MGMIRDIRRLRRDDQGVAAVEFAMIAPIFIGLILAVIDIGRYMWVLNTMQYAIDEAVRAGVVQELSDEDIVQRAKDSLITVGASSIVIDASSDAESITVTADSTYKFIFPLSAFAEGTTISLSSQMPL
jgi:Flp pilus assembly protein TadG